MISAGALDPPRILPGHPDQRDADFGDIFEVKAKALPPRLGIRRVLGPRDLTLVYERDGFHVVHGSQLTIRRFDKYQGLA
jgi:hypothetical protein